MSGDERAQPEGVKEGLRPELAFLREATLTPHGILAGSSNQALLCTASMAGCQDLLVVYKPGRGERALWDFPPGLFRREVAAARVAASAGWDLIPETVLREGPYGPGAVQRYIDHDPGEHYLALMPAHADEFRLAAALDLVMNNADRKSGHCLRELDTGRVFLVDHGLCFHAEDKLRTVIWAFAGEALAPRVRDGLLALASGHLDLDDLLAPEEREMIARRATALLEAGVYPHPPQDRPAVPWPLI